jgi:choice-of-anchor B domain-containing protein
MAGTGDWLFVGDPSSVHAPGRVVVYRRDGGEWAEAARLEAGDAEVGDGFGGAVAADGDRLVVGAPASGAVYVFQQTGSSEGGGEWTQTARLTPSTSPTGQFGGTVAVRGDVVFAGVTSAPFTMNPGPGAVTTFRTDGESWEETQTLQPDDLAGGDGFGEALAVTDTHLFVGAPGTSGRSGAVHVFDTSGDGTWTRAQTLTGVSGRFGAALATRGAVLWIGAPRADRQRGAVQAARLEGDAWSIGSARLQPFDGPANARFGVSLAVTDDGTVWAGAPGAGDDAGALYGFARGEDGGWSRATRHRHPDTRAGDRLGSVLTAAGPDLAVGQPGTDYGAYMSGGSVVALFDAASGSWRGAPLTPPSRDVFSAVTGGKVDCRDGTAQVFDCEGVDLLSFLPIEDLGGERGVRLNDVWGWTDPETGRDYALVGRVDGTAFVDVTDPMNPVYVGELPKTEGSEAKIWRDVKVYQNHAFVVADNAGEHGMQVFDLTELRDVAPSERPKTFAETARYDGIHSAHNVFINQETGFAYVVAASGGGRTCGGGLHMVNVQEPTSPSFAGCFADPSTGRTGTGTTHDTQCIVYDGPDTDYQGREICFSANETAVSIADVTDKQNPESIATVSHPKSAYVHQGWLTEDRRYLYVNDELDELSGLVDRTRTLVFDVVDLDDPQLVTEFFLPTPASDHNLYVRGSTMYQANYTSGLRVVDISDPENPKEVGHFDTLPFGPDAPGFEGAFSNYPYFESGVVVVTSMQEGLFVVKKAETEL